MDKKNGFPAHRVNFFISDFGKVKLKSVAQCDVMKLKLAAKDDTTDSVLGTGPVRLREVCWSGKTQAQHT